MRTFGDLQIGDVFYYLGGMDAYQMVVKEIKNKGKKQMTIIATCNGQYDLTFNKVDINSITSKDIYTTLSTEKSEIQKEVRKQYDNFLKHQQMMTEKYEELVKHSDEL